MNQKAEQGKTVSSGGGRWFALECLPAVGLIVIVFPINLMGGPYTLKAAWIYAASTFASGDLAAVGFCFLLPLFTMSLQESHANKLRGQLMLGVLLTISFYWLTKLRPAEVSLHSELSADAITRSVVYLLASIALNYYALATVYRVRCAEADRG